MTADGYFPFGRPNSERPARMAKRSDAVVVGVYPSAWHLEWRAPQGLAGPDGRGGIKAMAVDVEPTVFWDGRADDFAERLSIWKKQVRFVDGKHGAIAPRSPTMNGSSGNKVDYYYLRPIGVSPDEASFTDVYPVFLIKTASSAGSREQGAAIRDEYDSIAPQMGVNPCTLPPRIKSAKLPAVAAHRFGDRLVADLTTAAAPRVITLGAEVWNTLVAIPKLDARPPAATFEHLYGDAYGAEGTLTIGKKRVAWIPLVHPGLLKGVLDANAPLDVTLPRTVPGWKTLHARWIAK